MTSGCLLGTSAQGTQGTTPLPHLYRAPASSSWTRSPVGVVAEAVHPLGGGGSPVPDGAGRHSRLPDGGPAGHAATAHPDSSWTTQHAFDSIFAAEGVKTVKTPPRTPRANCYAEKWTHTARAERTDQMLIYGERRLRSALSQHAGHYNRHRPHQSRQQRPPGYDDDQAAAPLNLPVRRRDQRVPPGRAADLMKHLVRHHAMSSEGVHGADTDDLPYPGFSQQRSVI